MDIVHTSLHKWVIWISDNVGEYVLAHKVLESKLGITFIRSTNVLDIIVATYKLKDIKDYHIIE